METKILEEVGLTKSEVSVYIALLDLGSSATGKIVDKAKVSSSKIYEILDRLIQKGLVGFIVKSGVKYFEAASTERIMDYMKDKEKEFARQKKELNEILPELDLRQKASKFKSEATIYKGVKGIETAFLSSLDLLKKGEEVLVMGIPRRSETLNTFFVKLGEERASRGIKERRIINESAKKDLQNLKKNLPLCQVKTTPEITPAAINIFKDRVIIFPETTEDPMLISIDNKEVAESFRIQFEFWWNQDANVTKGMSALKEAVYDYMDNLKSKEKYCVIGATFGEKGTDKDYADFFSTIHERRFQKKMIGKLIFQQEAREMIKKHADYRKSLEKSKTEYKFLPYKTGSPVAIFPSENKTLLVIEKKNPIIIIIKNKEVAESFKRNFDALWKISTD